MKIPRDVTVPISRVRCGFSATNGAAGRLSHPAFDGHQWRAHVTVPNHRPLKMGTLLGGVLKPVASHHKRTIEELNEKLGL